MVYEFYKYNFGDYIRDPSKVLPLDINQILNDQVAALKSQELLDTIDMIAKKRLFGEVYVYDSRNIMITRIDFHSGVCKDFKLLYNPNDNKIVLPLAVLFLRSERNRMVSFKERREHEEAV